MTFLEDGYRSVSGASASIADQLLASKQKVEGILTQMGIDLEELAGERLKAEREIASKGLAAIRRFERKADETVASIEAVSREMTESGEKLNTALSHAETRRDADTVLQQDGAPLSAAEGGAKAVSAVLTAGTPAAGTEPRKDDAPTAESASPRLWPWGNRPE